MEQPEIQKLILEAGSDALKLFGGSFEGGYQIQQNPLELSSFLCYAQTKIVSNYLEIGTGSYGTTRFLQGFLNIPNVYIMDLDITRQNKDKRETIDNNVVSLSNACNFQAYIGNSHADTAYEWLKNNGVKFDLVFIDGDHEYAGVKQDFEMILPYLNDGAIIAFHDIIICNKDVGRFVREIKEDLYPKIKFVRDFVDEDGTYGRAIGIGVYTYNE